MFDHAFLDDLREQPLRTVVQYYARCLDRSSQGLDHLQRSALFVAPGSRLMIGLADRSLGTQIPDKSLRAGKAIRDRLESVGIYRSNGREHFRGMLTLPLQSVGGQITGLYGRRIDTPLTKAADQHIGTGIFNAPAITEFDELIITQRVLDAWALVAAGYQHAICAVGCPLTGDQLSGVRRVILVGEGIDTQAFSGIQCHRLVLPPGLSVHGYCLKHCEDRFQRLAELLRAAPWLSGADDPSSSSLPPTPPPTTPTPPTPQKSPSVTPVPRPVEELEVVLSPDGDELNILIESRHWRVRGLAETSGLRLSVMVTSTHSQRFYLDSFDLVHARSRRSFVAQAAEEIGQCEGQLRSDLGRILLKIEQLQQQRKQAACPPGNTRPPQPSADERTAAIELLQSENLLERILEDFEACGVVGERTGKLVGYLAATSRLLDKPLGLIIQSSSAAGKSSLAEAILRLMPPEEYLSCSAMTPQSLYYMGQQDLRHKILSIAEEEGVRDAAYQLKLLQSEGQLSLVSSGKQRGSGRTVTERYQVQGPVALMLTTTSLDVEPELLNRCLVISIDESPAQTAAIHAQQRLAETLGAYIGRCEASKRVAIHQHAQRLLRRLPVINPFAQQLRFVGWETRHRRDHRKYLSLINTITLLHQYQRELKTIEVQGQRIEYLEVTKPDIALANQIADCALGRSIDELAETTRRLLIQLYDWLRSQADSQRVAVQEMSFTRRAARESLRWGSTQLNYHLDRLCRDEYVVRTSGCNGKLCQYKLLYDGRGCQGQPRLLQLVNASELREAQAV